MAVLFKKFPQLLAKFQERDKSDDGVIDTDPNANITEYEREIGLL